MQRTDLKNLLRPVVIFVSAIYVFLLLSMVVSHYLELITISGTNIYEVIPQYNWKYWFEGEVYATTYFSEFLQFIDIHYLHSRGIVPIIVNIGFIVATAYLVMKIIYELFDTEHSFTKLILVLMSIVLLFSSIQDSSIVWRFDQQLGAAYFLPLFAYYILLRFSSNEREEVFYLLLLSAVLIVFTTPYNISALIVLFLLGLCINASRLKKFLLILPLLLAFLLEYREIYNKQIILELFGSMKAVGGSLHYLLTYLGSPFVYISFEPCCATSSVVAGVFMIGTFVYFIYLWCTKRVTESSYAVILAFLAFYILTALSSLNTAKNIHIAVFKNSFMTPSLIAWSLVVILYIHFFRRKLTVKRRLMVGVLTLITVLYGYQIKTYIEYRQDNVKSKLAIAAIQLGIDDQYFLKEINRLVYVMRYLPQHKTDQKMSIFTVNDIRMKILQHQKRFLEKMTPFKLQDEMKAFVPSTTLKTDRVMRGALDKITYIDNKSRIVRLTGWIYNIDKKEVPDWLIVINAQKQIIGYIITGLPRKDVAQIYGGNALRSGFVGYMKSPKIPTEVLIVDDIEKSVVRAMYKTSSL